MARLDLPLAVLLLAHQAAGFPQMWINPGTYDGSLYNESDVRKSEGTPYNQLALDTLLAKSCTEHPGDTLLNDTTAANISILAHRYPHGVPVVSDLLMFELADSAGALVNTVCPGAKYALTVSYANLSIYFVTTTEGTLEGGVVQDANGPISLWEKCKNRVYSNSTKSGPRNATEGPASQTLNFTATLTVPCKPKESSLTFKCTSAGSNSARYIPVPSASKIFVQNTLTVPVDRTCAVKSCVPQEQVRSSPPPKPRSKSPPPRRRSPPPSHRHGGRRSLADMDAPM